MASDRFHKAAKDGLFDVLKEANRREVNSKDADGMTPVLWAAFEGRLDALRLLVGRGGEPDKCDQFGNTALHLSAAKGHLNCVDFLVKFGVNLYALDIDRHSAKDLAAINNRDNILMYLDAATANFEQSDKKKAKSQKDQAEKQCEKRIKEYAKKQQKFADRHHAAIIDTNADVKPMPHRPSTMLSDWKHRLWSTSQGNLLKPPQSRTPDNNLSSEPINYGSTKFSALVGSNGTISGPKGVVQRKAEAIRGKVMQNNIPAINLQSDEFKIGEIESNGKRSVRSLQGVRRDSEVIYVGTFSSNGDTVIGKRGKITDVFDMESQQEDRRSVDYDLRAENNNKTLGRSISQPDFFASIKNDNENGVDEIKEQMTLQRPSGLFDRPMLGTLAFRRSVAAALSELQSDNSNTNNVTKYPDNISNQIAAQPFQPPAKSIKPRSTNLVIDDSDESDCGDRESCDGGGSGIDEPGEDGLSALERFLAAWSLEDHGHIFKKQQIDLDTLMLLTESDLKSLGLPLGPFRKLVIAIQERKTALANPGTIYDSRI